MQPIADLLTAARSMKPTTLLVALALGVLGVAYSSLLTLGSTYGFGTEVEYWLFRPTDDAPLVIIVLSGWLLYRRWYRVRSLPRSTAHPIGLLVLVVLSLAFHGWAVYTRADDLKLVSLVLALSALTLATWGVVGLRALWVPIAFLLFAIPLPAPLLLAVVFKLQIWTANLAGALLYLLGVPVLVSGDQILRATQSFQVIEGCSGMRSIETLVMLTVLLIDLFGRRGWHAATLLVAAPFVAFLLNGFRVLTLILNPHSEIISIHNLQGILILLVGLLVIYGLDALIERFAGSARIPAWEAPDAGARPAFRPTLAASVLAVLALGTAGSLLWVPTWPDPAPADPSLHEVVADALDRWPSEKLDPDFAFRGSVRFGSVVQRRYSLGEGWVDVFAGTANLGERGGSPISTITALPGSGWLVREWTREPGSRDRSPVDVLVVEKSKQRRLVWRWYGGRESLLMEVLRSLLALDRSPLRRSDLLYVVRLETSIDGRDEEAEARASARLSRVADELRPAMTRLE